MTAFFDRRLRRIAAAGAVVGVFTVALGVAGCGRKGGLEPRPSAVAVDPAVAGQPRQGGEGGKTAAPAKPPPRRTPLDWLID